MTDCTPIHVPVLADEVLDWLRPQPGQRFADGTLGGGGHTRLLAQRVGAAGLIVSLDRDPEALSRCEKELAGLPVLLVRSNFCELPAVLRQVECERLDGILLDLGLSSDQLADDKRGFSFNSSGPLDLRFDPERGEPAWKLINRLSAEHLADAIYQFGEERYSRRIARKIVETRKSAPIKTAVQLAQLVRACVPASRQQQIDPATRTFQALRIAVNEELKSLDVALRCLPDCLREGGRLAILSFHSLEDRRVKDSFRDDERLQPLTKKPIRPTHAEIEANPRSRSARLRVAQRL